MTVSDDFLNKYSAQAISASEKTGQSRLDQTVDSISNIPGFVAATVTDIGTSLFNSVVALPRIFGANTKDYEVSTYDLLKQVNNNWASLYSANEESVQTASFIGGVLLPAGLAIKGMKALQAGKFAMYPSVLSDASQTARLAQLEEMLMAAKAGSSEFQAVRWRMLSAVAGQEVVQTVGAEIAIVASLNQHPWMEDYLKDPWSNFALSTMLGGGIGTMFGRVVLNKTIANRLGASSSGEMDKIISKLGTQPLGVAEFDGIQRMNADITKLIDIAAEPGQSLLARQIAGDYASILKGQVGLAEKRALSTEIQAMPADVQLGIREVAMSDNAYWANHVSFVKYDTRDFIAPKGKAGELLKTTPEQLAAMAAKHDALWDAGLKVQSSLISSDVIKTLRPDALKLLTEGHHMAYSPYHKAWIPQSEMGWYTRAVDTGKTNWGQHNVFKIDPDASLNYVKGVPSATVDGMWIDALGSAAKAQFGSKIYVAAGDMAMQNAIISRITGTVGKEAAASGKPSPLIYLVSDLTGDLTQAGLKKRGVTITIEDLQNNLAREKSETIALLIKEGASFQEIGIKVNMPTSVVEQYVAGGKRLQDIEGWRGYTDAGEVESKYMHASTKMLQFSTNGYKMNSMRFRNSDMSANLDAAKIAQTNREYIRDIVAAGGADNLNQEVLLHLAKQDMRKTVEMLHSMLSNVVNEKMGSGFFSSADMALRHMGEINGLATVMGQGLMGVLNKQSRELLTPLATKTRTILATQSKLNELNKLINLRNSMSEYVGLDTRTGELYKNVADSQGAIFKVPLKNEDGTLVTMSPEVKEWVAESWAVGRIMYNTKNTQNRIPGHKELSDRGWWLPSFNPSGKFISYVIDKEATEGASHVKILAGKTPQELIDMEISWKSQNGGNKRFELVTKGQQEDYNFWHMRQDPIEMDFVDISKFHSGASASALDIVDDSFVTTIVENLHNRVIHYGRKLQQMYLDDVMKTLDGMSAVNQKHFADQATPAKSIGVNQPKDAAMYVKNVILGDNQLGQHQTYQSWNNGFSSMVEYAGRKVSEIYRGLRYTDKEQRILKPGEYIRLAKELEDNGVPYLFKGYEEYLAFQGTTGSYLKVYHGTTQTFDGYRHTELGAHFGSPAQAFEAATRHGDPNVNIRPEYMKANKIIEFTDAQVNSPTELLNEMQRRSIVSDAAATEVKAIMGSSRGQVVWQEAFNILNKELRDKGYDVVKYVNTVEDALQKTPSYIALDSSSPNVVSRMSREGARIKTTEYKNQLERLRTQEVARKLGVPYATAEEMGAASNGLLSTIALRVFETGHAAVTAMSWPIMMLPEFYRTMPKTYLGNAAGEGIGVAYPMRAMTDGIRFRHSDMAKPLIAEWIAEGFGKPIVSEASAVRTALDTGGKGAVERINRVIHSDIVQTLSSASDFMEAETRLWVLSTGYQFAKRAYPGISQGDASQFAKEFLLKSVGNYYSGQRPAMFQGNFGVSIGLFQTYMLSWSQQLYRSIEDRSAKAIAAQMLSQAGLFGMSSLPLYDNFSKLIGEHFSDKNYDLTTGTYRALPDPAAEFVVYGLPASLGVGLYTRGDMQPRLPFGSANVLDTFAAINATRQLIGATGNTITKVMEANGLQGKIQGLMEGVAMQSLNRPMARVVEAIPIPDGYGGWKAVGSINRDGNVVATSEEIWSGPGLMSRLLSSRSTEEQVKREADYLNTFYGAADHDNRKRATSTLKAAMRANNLTDEVLSKTAGEYLRSGTATGWNAALNEALATTESGINHKLGHTLRPDSPLRKMIDQYK